MVAETNALVRGIAVSPAAHQPSKPARRGNPPGEFDSHPPPLGNLCPDPGLRCGAWLWRTDGDGVRKPKRSLQPHKCCK